MKGKQKLNEETLNSYQSLNTAGVYKIYLHSEGRPMAIPRVLKQDDSGLLYIGQSRSNARYRLWCFLRSMNLNYRQHNHSGGMRVFHHQGLQELISKNELMFEFITSPEPKKLEEIELNNYRTAFGEVPPLNS
jgi:hypothetical protein